ncbi:MAG TPA: hypothetical protein VF179_19125 [Thermoanaerobaculia bacterium]|nr:hypothetical protein [Thermoanaerobaculia bacterium]
MLPSATESAVPPPTFSTLAADEWRLLTFRRPSAAVAVHWKSYLAFGLVFTWLAGIGRYWDNPRAQPWQYGGLGSVAYVFVLALIVWLLILPLKPRRWSYKTVLTFIALTSVPALLYAIPVERFMPLGQAQSVNAWFLAVIAAWRVALLAVFLRRVASLSGVAILVASLLPLVLIVVALTALNLEHVVFSIMAGIPPGARTGNDLAYVVVGVLAYASVHVAPFLAVAYAWLAYRARRASHE